MFYEKNILFNLQEVTIPFISKVTPQCVVFSKVCKLQHFTSYFIFYGCIINIIL